MYHAKTAHWIDHDPRDQPLPTQNPTEITSMTTDPQDPTPDVQQLRDDIRKIITLDVNLVRIFVLLADTGSFAAAATDLGCGSTTLRHRITTLERDFGARLLSRER
jgi:hypothetical protein